VRRTLRGLDFGSVVGETRGGIRHRRVTTRWDDGAARVAFAGCGLDPLPYPSCSAIWPAHATNDPRSKSSTNGTHSIQRHHLRSFQTGCHRDCTVHAQTGAREPSPQVRKWRTKRFLAQRVQRSLPNRSRDLSLGSSHGSRGPPKESTEKQTPRRSPRGPDKPMLGESRRRLFPDASPVSARHKWEDAPSPATGAQSLTRR